MASENETKADVRTEAQFSGREPTFKGLEDLLEDIQKVAELEPVIRRIEEAFKRIDNMQDNRSTSIKVGTGTRHQAKIYFDPTKPKEAKEIIETSIDMLELGQMMLEDGEGDE